MSLLRRLFSRDIGDRASVRPLYEAIVAEARLPVWYAEGGVPDSVDGRFDMLALILSVVLVRLEDEGEAGKVPSTLLAETFIDDMDGQLRQIGIGDIMVGKHIGKMMSALGGRLSAYRETIGADDRALGDALVRNLYRGEAPSPASLASVVAGIRALHTTVAAVPRDGLLSGKLR